eukprot:6203745-Pleurochrysis_carterae.AAC.3
MHSRMLAVQALLLLSFPRARRFLLGNAFRLDSGKPPEKVALRTAPSARFARHAPSQRNPPACRRNNRLAAWARLRIPPKRAICPFRKSAEELNAHATAHVRACI